MAQRSKDASPKMHIGSSAGIERHYTQQLGKLWDSKIPNSTVLYKVPWMGNILDFLGFGYMPNLNVH